MSRDRLRSERRTAAPEKPKSERRRALDFAIQELESCRDMLAEMAPATDNVKLMRWRVRALERTIAELRRPHFEVSPLI